MATNQSSERALASMGGWEWCFWRGTVELLLSASTSLPPPGCLLGSHVHVGPAHMCMLAPLTCACWPRPHAWGVALLIANECLLKLICLTSLVQPTMQPSPQWGFIYSELVVEGKTANRNVNCMLVLFYGLPWVDLSYVIVSETTQSYLHKSVGGWEMAGGGGGGGGGAPCMQENSVSLNDHNRDHYKRQNVINLRWICRCKVTSWSKKVCVWGVWWV